MKRILVLLTMVALMMVMLAIGVMPAFAHGDPCTGQNPTIVTVTPSSFVDRDGDGYICQYDRYDKEGALVDRRFRDDHAMPFGSH